MVTLSRYVWLFHYFDYGSSSISSVSIDKFWAIVLHRGQDSCLLRHFQFINLQPHDGIKEESGLRKS
jgi:hypothetical protein